jgi:diaminopimelate epimerase
MSLAFTKMHGLGNDFMVVLAAMEDAFPEKDVIISMADRKEGVGFDQLLWIIADATDADFELRIFNADGGEAEQCGNGLRCVARYIHEHALKPGTVWQVKTLGGICRVWYEGDDLYGADLGAPVLSPEAVPFIADGMANLYRLNSPWGVLDIGVVSLGNPHAVLRVADLASDDYEEKVRFISQSARFPRGVNVGVCMVDDAQNLRLRVFERGAGWTDACGTGAAASVVVAKRNHWMQDDAITVTQPGGSLTVCWSQPLGVVSICGHAATVFDGVWAALSPSIKRANYC